jgi:hypothetical protein
MINLLPVSFRRQQMMRKRAIQWMVAVCFVIAAGWVSHWYELREQIALSQQLEVLSREHQPTQTMLKQLVKMRDRLNNLQQQEAIARELECQRNPLVLLGVISKTAHRTKGRLRVTKLDLSDFQKTSQGTGAGAAGAPSSSLVLTGVSRDDRPLRMTFRV